MERDCCAVGHDRLDLGIFETVTQVRVIANDWRGT